MNEIFGCRSCGNVIAVGGMVNSHSFSLAVRGARFVENSLHISLICEKCGGKPGQLELRKF